MIAFNSNAQISNFIVTSKERYIPKNYVDYIIIGGQSNIDNRININNLPDGYEGVYDSVKFYNNGSLSTFTPGSNAKNGTVGYYSWDALLLKMLTDSFDIEVKFTKHSFSNTSIGFTGATAWHSLIQHPYGSWNINVEGSHYDKIKEYILNIKQREKLLGNVARFRLIIWDQKESDCGLGGDTLTSYIYSDDGVLKGNFVDFMDEMRRITGNSNLPVLYMQEMSSQACSFSDTMINKQILFDSLYPYSYMIPAEEYVDSITLQDTQHYDPAGTYFVAKLSFEIIKNNNLLNNWK
jgi:hypothetical protein